MVIHHHATVETKQCCILLISVERITVVNTHFCTKKISTVLGSFDVAEFENDIGFSELALVFEIFHIFVSKKC